MKKGLLYCIIFSFGFFIAVNYEKEVNEGLHTARNSVSVFFKNNGLMERAKVLSQKAKNSKSIIYEKFAKKSQNHHSMIQKKNKTIYAYGTDSFDPSNNARCVILNTNTLKDKKKEVELFCQGKLSLQQKLKSNIHQKVQRGEL